MDKNTELKLNEHKMCFIICSNNETYLKECLFYISRLDIPAGYEIDVMSIWDAKSMTGGYNEGMKASDARYKIYLHQDVFILYKGFLQSVLDIFQSDNSIGMIGMVGAPRMPAGGIMWYGYREGQVYGFCPIKGEYGTYKYVLEDGLHEVDAVDGLLMVTNTDILWREDIFDGWDFYDVSQSFEFHKAGYKVVVPEQLCPWCKHDDGVLNLVQYDKYRKICMKEYPKYFYTERFSIKKAKKSNDSIGNVQKNLCVVIIARNQFQQVRKSIASIKRFSGLDNSQIVIVDNGSEDGLRHWIKEQDYNYIICGEMVESYAAILNEVIKQFIKNQDMLVISAELSLLPGCVEKLYEVLKADQRTGAVSGRKVLEKKDQKNFFENMVRSIGNHVANKINTGKREIIGLPGNGVLLRNELLKQIECFDEDFGIAEYIMLDFAYQGKAKGYRYYEVEDAYFYKTSKELRSFLEQTESLIDKQLLKDKWTKYEKKDL